MIKPKIKLASKEYRDHGWIYCCGISDHDLFFGKCKMSAFFNWVLQNHVYV